MRRMGSMSFLVVLALTSARVAAAGCEHDRILLGVDYYPEQWPLEDMHADMAAIKTDLGADFIRVGEFMWHEIEPREGLFNFTLLDGILAAAEGVGLEVMLGTPTATMPAWLHLKHPDVLTRGPDSPEGYSGAMPAFGGRRQYSFNSETYRRYARRVVAALAERYADRRSIALWQIDNEPGHENSDLDFSNNSLQAWRAWLAEAYAGDVSRLNGDWGAVFWGASYNSFDEVPLPGWTMPGSPARPNENFRSNSHPGMLLDFRRFRRDSVTSFLADQVAILRRESVRGCVTTNAPGGFWGKALDHNDIFAGMDLPSYDNYPVWGGSVEPTPPSKVALALDTARGWALGAGQSGAWMVAEQLIGAQGHDIVGYTPRPGQVVAWAGASLLHGATSLAFFRYRAAVFGQEQFCYGILDHATPRGTGRKWKEVKGFYSLARQHQRLWLSSVSAQIALLYDTDNIFAWQAQPQSLQFDFESEAHRFYYPFWRNGATVDVLSSRRLLMKEEAAEMLFRYKIVLLPVPMLTSDALISLLRGFLQNGGSLWVGFRSDLKDERSQIRRAPSRLAEMAGAEVMEIESLNYKGTGPLSYTVRSTHKAKGAAATAGISVWREGLRVREGSSAKVLWEYTDDFFGKLGYAAVTRDQSESNKSEAIYVAAGIDPEALVPLAASSLQRQGVEHAGLSTNPNVEQALRRDLDGHLFHVTINHDLEAVPLENSSPLQPFQIRIVNGSLSLFGHGATPLMEDVKTDFKSKAARIGWGSKCLLALTILGIWIAGRRVLVGDMMNAWAQGRNSHEQLL